MPGAQAKQHCRGDQQPGQREACRPRHSFLVSSRHVCFLADGAPGVEGTHPLDPPTVCFIYGIGSCNLTSETTRGPGQRSDRVAAWGPRHRETGGKKGSVPCREQLGVPAESAPNVAVTREGRHAALVADVVSAGCLTEPTGARAAG